MKKMLFVFNPNSGKAQMKNRLVDILNVFNDAEYEVVVYPTRKTMDAYEYIEKNGNKYDVIVCGGGDGTLNETTGAVLKLGRKVPIGYIPSGTTNDFAKSLGISSDMIKAAEAIVNGMPLSCDIGYFNKKRTFNYIAAFGAFTEVSYATPQNLKNLLGHQAYVLEGVKSMLAMKPVFLRALSDEKQIAGSFIYGMVSNTNSVGGFKGLAGKGVDLNDGLFEVTLIREINNPIQMQQVVNALVMRKFDGCDMICSFKTKAIEFEMEKELPWTIDGEYGGDIRNAAMEVLPKAVTFMR